MLKLISKVINQGEAFIATSKNGTKTLVNGPTKILFPFRFNFQPLKLHIVDENNYALIRYTDGKSMILKGPTSLFENPTIHNKIEVRKNMWIDEFDSIRVYTHGSDANNENKIISEKYITGPNYYTPEPNETITKLTLLKAQPGEYIRICHKNGKVEIINGPCSVSRDDVIHSNVSVEQCLVLKSNECVIVYRQDNSDITQSIQTTLRVIVNGPCYYTPTPNETYHAFSWHGHDPANKDKVGPGFNRKMPNALKFKILTLAPRQIYLDVTHVRTRDDAEITACFMVFFELINVELMLDTTTDPIGDIVNAHTSDVISFVSKRTFDELKSTSNELNKLEHFPQMAETMEKRGYKISNITFRGYLTNNKLQKMHDDAIEARTALVLERDTEKERQDIMDFKLAKTKQRNIEENLIKHAQVKNKIDIENMELNADLNKQHARLIADLEKQDSELGIVRNQNLEKINYYNKLKEIGIDVTRVMVEKEMASTKIDKMIRIVSDKQDPINIKLIENATNKNIE